MESNLLDIVHLTNQSLRVFVCVSYISLVPKYSFVQNRWWEIAVVSKAIGQTPLESSLTTLSPDCHYWNNRPIILPWTMLECKWSLIQGRWRVSRVAIDQATKSWTVVVIGIAAIGLSLGSGLAWVAIFRYKNLPELMPHSDLRLSLCELVVWAVSRRFLDLSLHGLSRWAL